MLNINVSLFNAGLIRGVQIVVTGSIFSNRNWPCEYGTSCFCLLFIIFVYLYSSLGWKLGMKRVTRLTSQIQLRSG